MPDQVWHDESRLARLQLIVNRSRPIPWAGLKSASAQGHLLIRHPVPKIRSREPSPAQALAVASISANTRRAYTAALGRLDTWIAEMGVPLSDPTLAEYLSEVFEDGWVKGNGRGVLALGGRILLGRRVSGTPLRGLDQAGSRPGRRRPGGTPP